MTEITDKNGTKNTRPTLTRRINEYLGDKPHVYYLIYGLTTALAFGWAFFVFVLQPIIDHNSSRVFDRQQDEINQLRRESDYQKIQINALRDTIVTLQSFGQYLGKQELFKKDDQQPLVGKRIKASIFEINERNVNIYLQIDTCRQSGGGCKDFSYYLPIALGGYGPLYLGQEVYTFACEKASDSSVWISVYRHVER